MSWISRLSFKRALEMMVWKRSWFIPLLPNWLLRVNNHLIISFSWLMVLDGWWAYKTVIISWYYYSYYILRHLVLLNHSWISYSWSCWWWLSKWCSSTCEEMITIIMSYWEMMLLLISWIFGMIHTIYPASPSVSCGTHQLVSFLAFHQRF